MVYAIISDIHANAIALSAALEDARRCGAMKILCLGDVVGYGPEPEATTTAIRIKASLTIAGNHDDAVSGRLDASDFIDLAADAVSRHREMLSDENLAWLKSLPHVYNGKSFSCTHGDFISPKTFGYISDEDEAKANFSICKAQLMFAGHSHIPGIFLTGASGRVYSLPPTDFTIEDGKRYIVNPGSIGYPRTNGNVCESTYVLYDDEEQTISFRRIPFAVRSVMQTGRNPKRLKKRTLCAIICTAVFAASSAAWMLAPEKRVETVTEVVSMAYVDRTTSLPLAPESKRTRVEVKLAKGSPAAQLRLQFTDAAGNILWEERWTARKSKKATVRTPVGAVSAILSGGRVDGDIPATFNTFSLSIKE